MSVHWRFVVHPPICAPKPTNNTTQHYRLGEKKIFLCLVLLLLLFPSTLFPSISLCAYFNANPSTNTSICATFSCANESTVGMRRVTFAWHISQGLPSSADLANLCPISHVFLVGQSSSFFHCLHIRANLAPRITSAQSLQSLNNYLFPQHKQSYYSL